jgi:hypothetical protein
MIAAIDSRIPTFGFERMIVVPESDFKTRLDVLTRVMQVSDRGQEGGPPRRSRYVKVVNPRRFRCRRLSGARQ